MTPEQIAALVPDDDVHRLEPGADLCMVYAVLAHDGDAVVATTYDDAGRHVVVLSALTAEQREQFHLPADCQAPTEAPA